MLRTLACAGLGWVVGAGLTAGLLWVVREILRWQTAPRTFEIEHAVIYLAVVMGAGFGALCGALAGLAGLLARSRRVVERE